jgi:hypothetical protein
MGCGLLRCEISSQNKQLYSNMKKYLLLSIISFCGLQLFSQNGLEAIIVETYYISDENDATVNADGGELPVGSVTRRIYVDMLPGYKLQAVYGSPEPFLHELRIATTTLFFNNEDRGAISPTYTKTQARNNTVMLDSWVSVGGACAGQIGVLKTADDGIDTNVNNDDVLSNANPAAGIPLTEQDGMITGTINSPTRLGADNQFAMLDAQNDGTNGPVFSTTDGSWASLGGSMGPDAETNQVLIAQITTDGILSFELNIQIGTPEGNVEKYVASNPIADNGEFLFPGLTYVSDVPTKSLYPSLDDKAISLFPNPALDEISFKLEGINNTPLRYSIFDMRGGLVSVRTIANYTSESTETIDISSLSKGQYILEVISNGKRSINRFVKN